MLTRASAKANLLYNSSQVGLRDMQLTLDDSTLTGRVALEGEQLTYDLTVDDINVDRYLPPSEEARRAGRGGLARRGRPAARRAAHLDARGELKFGQAKFSGLTLTNAAFALTAANGAVRLTPSAQLYGGRFDGDIRVQVESDCRAHERGAEPRRRGPRGARPGPARLAGHHGHGRRALEPRRRAGQNVGEMRRGLDGDVAFTVTNGSLEGIDLWYELRRARARLDGAELPERGDAARRTTFSSLSATRRRRGRAAHEPRLERRLDFMTIDGTGTVNLLDDMIDFDLTATMVDGPVLQSDPEMVKYAGESLPLRVTGTLAAPSRAAGLRRRGGSA